MYILIGLNSNFGWCNIPEPDLKKTEQFYNSPLINMKSVSQETYMTGKDVQKENKRSFNPSNKFAFTFRKFLPGYVDLTNSWPILEENESVQPLSRI